MARHAYTIGPQTLSQDAPAERPESATPNTNPYPALDRPIDIPGAELPASVYLSVAAAFGWMMLAALFAFGGGGEAGFNLSMATALVLIFLALPLLIYRTATRHAPRSGQSGRRLPMTVETATGELSRGSAWLQILLIPAALAVAATLIGVVYILFA